MSADRNDGTWRSFDEEPTRLSGPLNAVARRLGVPTAAGAHQLFSSWGDIVGPSVAGHSRPLALRDGRLLVGVDHGAWAASLRQLERTLLDRCDAVLGKGVVTSLDVRVRPDLDAPA